MDRLTFASLYPGPERLAPALASLAPHGTPGGAGGQDAFALLAELKRRPPAGADDSSVNELIDFLELVTLAGIGVEKALALRDAGVTTVAGLAQSEDEALHGELSRRLPGRRLTAAEIRVWLRAARRRAAR
jgi:hypothetical protein